MEEFQNIKLLRNETIGVGAYGKVCKAKCDDLICAAKIFHETLYDPREEQHTEPQKLHRMPSIRFKAECMHLHNLKHPNIVQYLGETTDTITGMKVLLMELMDGSLTNYLDNYPFDGPIPYHIQVNFCHDISRAISYLHSKHLVHRDLSSNNVLLISNIRAKVSDFGMVMIYGQDIRKTPYLSLTGCPGTDVYMPPGAARTSEAEYTEKIDCFSLGVVAIQIMTKQYPSPGKRHKIIKTLDLSDTHSVLVPVSEVERRQNHISLIAPNHPLLAIALDCLKDEDKNRPSAHELCQRIDGLKVHQIYLESQQLPPKSTSEMSPLNDKTHEEDELEKDEEVFVQARSEIHTSHGTVNKDDPIPRPRSTTELQPSKKIQSLQMVLKKKDEMIKIEQNNIEQLKQHITQVESENRKLLIVKQHYERRCLELERRLGMKSDFELNWNKEDKAPCLMKRGGDAVVSGNYVYIRHAGAKEVYEYNSTTKVWIRLPDCPFRSCSLAILKDLLTTVGGLPFTNQLFSLTGNSTSKPWMEVYPPMPSKRQWATTLSMDAILLVAGGVGEGDVVLSVVEILDAQTSQWSRAARLPEPFHRASATICHGHIYMLGATGEGKRHTKSVFTCHLNDLLHSTSSSLMVWSKIADLPVTKSTCVSLNHQLLAIGGKDADDKVSAAVHLYDSATKTWRVISHMSIARRSCFAAVLPDNKLMVVGGWVSTYIDSDSVEIATYTC